jgi:hypothetical protein
VRPSLVLQGDVEPLDDGSIRVGSSDPTRWYHLVGHACTCTDFTTGTAPESWCKHRIAAGIAKRVHELLPEAPAAPAQDETTALRIPAHFLTTVQGTRCIKYAGLLALAHAAGLTSLSATFTYNDAELSIAHAVALFADGRRFEESGDATPSNAARVKEHWRRMALTRSKARCLRDALAIDVVSVEEME